MPGPVNALTVDVEDWYQGIEIGPERWDSFESRIGESLPRVLDLFAERGVRGTFFVLGWLAERRPDLVRRIAAAGHEIGTHGQSHRLVYQMEQREFEEELRRSVAALEDIAGARVVAHRAPFFSITTQSLWALEALAANGISVDSSIFPVRNYRYGIPDAPRFPYWQETSAGRIAEFPLSTVRLFGRNLPMAGGFYLRALPYPILRRAIAAVNRENKPAIIYIHPWEVDPDHPRIPLPRRIGLTHYHNLRSTIGKLRRLLRDLSFAPLGEITADIT